MLITEYGLYWEQPNPDESWLDKPKQSIAIQNKN